MKRAMVLSRAGCFGEYVLRVASAVIASETYVVSPNPSHCGRNHADPPCKQVCGFMCSDLRRSFHVDSHLSPYSVSSVESV